MIDAELALTETVVLPKMTAPAARSYTKVLVF